MGHRGAKSKEEARANQSAGNLCGHAGHRRHPSVGAAPRFFDDWKIADAKLGRCAPTHATLNEKGSPSGTVPSDPSDLSRRAGSNG